MAAGADAKSEGDAGDPVVPTQKLLHPSSSSTPYHNVYISFLRSSLDVEQDVLDS
jgi:hypothetical protein